MSECDVGGGSKAWHIRAFMVFVVSLSLSFSFTPCPFLSQAAANVEAMKLDLASLQSIADFAIEFIGRDIPLHVLVCNAGILSPSLR